MRIRICIVKNPGFLARGVESIADLPRTSVTIDMVGATGGRKLEKSIIINE